MGCAKTVNLLLCFGGNFVSDAVCLVRVQHCSAAEWNVSRIEDIITQVFGFDVNLSNEKMFYLKIARFCDSGWIAACLDFVTHISELNHHQGVVIHESSLNLFWLYLDLRPLKIRYRCVRDWCRFFLYEEFCCVYFYVFPMNFYWNSFDRCYSALSLFFCSWLFFFCFLFFFGKKIADHCSVSAIV